MFQRTVQPTRYLKSLLKRLGILIWPGQITVYPLASWGTFHRLPEPAKVSAEDFNNFHTHPDTSTQNQGLGHPDFFYG